MNDRDSSTRVKQLGQYMTPSWAAQELVASYFPDLTLFDMVIEPSCGDGAFLEAIPDHVPAIGMEIEPALAAMARERTGRHVIEGDFATAPIDVHPSAIIGNPPFKSTTVNAFLDRAWTLLRPDGRVGFILPCYSLKTASTVTRLAMRWDIRQDMLPSNLFRQLAHPLCFVLLRKVAGRQGTLEGFALYRQTHAVTQLQQVYRRILHSGERSVWSAVVRAAVEVLGGEAPLQEIYAEIEGDRPTENIWWRARVRATLQRVGVRTAPGTWAIVNRNRAQAT